MDNIIGKVIQGYKVLGEIGTTSRLHVFVAATPNEEEMVLIRIYPEEFGRSRMLFEQLRNSLQSVTRLQHPGIQGVLGSGVLTGRPFVVMPYAEAGSLQDRFNSGLLVAVDVGDLISEVAAALDYAHSHGVVHGNLKPADICFDENGNVQVGGFGESTVLINLTPDAVQELDGFGPYQAPEVKQGREMTPRSDQYSLALLALQLVTRLTLPEALNGLDVCIQKRQGLISYPTRMPVELAHSVVDFFTKALSEDPTDRFETIDEMNRAFQEAMRYGDSEPDEPLRKVEVDKKPKKRRKFGFLIPAISVLLCALIAVPALAFEWIDLPDAISFTNGGVFESVDESVEYSGQTKISLPEEVDRGDKGQGDIVTIVDDPVEESSGSSGGDPAPTSTQSSLDDTGSTEEENPPPQNPTQESPAEPTQSVPVEPSSTPYPTPTLTMPPTTEVPEVTPTMEPTSTSEPAIPPDKCRSNPNHRRYCTPTPSP
ncbi:MAG: protein kinase [Anaerolineales bacterium]|nr:protein kinase [Anaerolineales bacterium]